MLTFSGSTPQLVRRWVDGVRQGFEERRRAADAVTILTIATVIVAETDEETQARLEEYPQHVDIEGALAVFGGRTGVDLSGLDPDATLELVQIEANHSTLATFTTLSTGPTWTVRDLAEVIAIGGRGPVIVGSPSTVADALERWREESGVDGFNITAVVPPQTSSASSTL